MNAKQRTEIVDVLNHALEHEHAAAIQYFTEAATVRGLMSDAFRDKFLRSAAEEIEHAKRLRDRIVTLGGTPTTRVAQVRTARKVAEMVKINAETEGKAADLYIGLLKKLVKGEDLLLYETIERIVEETLHDLEEYQRLLEKDV